MEEELYRKAFGGSAPPIEGEVPVEFVLDGESLGEIPVVVSGPANAISAEVQAAQLFERLKGILNDETVVRLERDLSTRTTVTPEMLKAFGWDASVDLTSIQLRVSVPAEQRKLRKIRLVNLEPPTPSGTVLEMEDVSGYLNLFAGAGYDYSPGPTWGFEPLSLRMPAGVRLWDGVLEADSVYSEGVGDAYRVEALRVVYDQPEKRLRWTAGDTFVPTVGFQRSQQVGGLAFGRQWSLQPYSLAYPQGDVSFLLQEASEVEVWANGRRLQNLNLPPGQYSFADFPLIYGENSVELVIRDRSGRVQVVQQDILYDRRLLAAGFYDWGMTLGAPSRQDGIYRAYDLEGTLVSGFVRAPIGAATMGGVSLQANRFRQMGGVDGLLLTPWGATTADAAGSRSDVDAGYAVSISHRMAQNPAGNTFLNSVSLGVRYQSESFGTLGESAVYNPVGWSANLGATIPLHRSLRLGVLGTQSFGRRQTPDITGVGLNLGRSFRNGMDVRLTANWNSLPANVGTWRLGFTFTYIPRQRVQTEGPTDFYRGSYRYPGDEAVGTWQRTLGSGVGSSTYSFDWQSRGLDWGQTLQARYYDERAQLGIGHSINGISASDQVGHRTRVNVGTALVVAGGTLAMSQPVNDSFVVAKAGTSGDAAPLFGGLDGPARSWSSGWGWLGPRVNVGQSSYLVNRLELFPGHGDAESALQSTTASFRPAYKSAAVLRSVFARTVALQGMALLPDGVPLGLRQGLLISISESIGVERIESIPVVTGADGLFEIPDVRPGRYRLEFPGDPGAVATIEVPERGTMVDLGAVILQPWNPDAP